MAKHKHQPQIVAPSKLRLPVIIGVVALVVLAGYWLVRYTLAASGTMSVRTATTAAVALDSNVTVSIYANGGTDALNAVQANLTYPIDKLQYVSYDNTGSSFPLDAASPTGTPNTGSLQFTRSTQGGAAAVTGDALVLKVTFKAIALGSAPVNLATTSLGLRASDSTNVITAYNGTTLTIADATIPSTPSGVTSSGNTITTVKLNWSAATDNVGVTGYRVYRNTALVGSPTATTYTDTALAPSTSYSYTVAAVDAAGNVSGKSTALNASTLADTTAPAVVTGLTSTNRTLTGINLKWNASTDDVAVTGYQLLRNGVVIASPTVLTYNDTGLTPGTNYTYAVAAVDAAGNKSASTPTNTIIATLPDTNPPTVPAGLTVTGQASNSVNLSWTAATDNVAVTGYKVYRDGTQISSTASTSGSFALPTTPGTYNYTISAVDGAGNTSAQSTSVSVSSFGPADVNRDGHVSVIDLSMLLSNWGRAGTGDINGDSTVNVIDLSMLLGAWTG